MPKDEPLYTTAEVAEMLSVSVATVKRLVRSGDLDAVRLGYHTVRFRQSAIDAFIRRHGTREGE